MLVRIFLTEIIEYREEIIEYSQLNFEYSSKKNFYLKSC